MTRSTIPTALYGAFTVYIQNRATLFLTFFIRPWQYLRVLKITTIQRSDWSKIRLHRHPSAVLPLVTGTLISLFDVSARVLVSVCTFTAMVCTLWRGMVASPKLDHVVSHHYQHWFLSSQVRHWCPRSCRGPVPASTTSVTQDPMLFSHIWVTTNHHLDLMSSLFRIPKPPNPHLPVNEWSHLDPQILSLVSKIILQLPITKFALHEFHAFCLLHQIIGHNPRYFMVWSVIHKDFIAYGRARHRGAARQSPLLIHVANPLLVQWRSVPVSTTWYDCWGRFKSLVSIRIGSWKQNACWIDDKKIIACIRRNRLQTPNGGASRLIATRRSYKVPPRLLRLAYRDKLHQTFNWTLV